MATDTAFPDWNWDDPDGLADRMVGMHDDLARCKTLEPTPADYRDHHHRYRLA